MLTKFLPHIGIAAAVVVLCLVVACWWQSGKIDGLQDQLQDKVGEISTLETAGKAKDATLAELRKESAVREAVLVERQSAAIGIETKRQADLTALKEAMRNDPHTDSWAAVALPAPVLGMLR